MPEHAAFPQSTGGAAMGVFGKILDTLGLGSVVAAIPAAKEAVKTVAAQAAAAKPAVAPAKPAASVDVVAQMEQRAAKSAQKLNWKTSIVDLLKLLDIDSSLAARKALATELGAPAAVMGDSAKMNMWLHKAVLARIAQNGGNIPASLLD
jgi:hypothetical protein